MSKTAWKRHKMCNVPAFRVGIVAITLTLFIVLVARLLAQNKQLPPLAVGTSAVGKVTRHPIEILGLKAKYKVKETIRFRVRNVSQRGGGYYSG